MMSSKYQRVDKASSFVVAPLKPWELATFGKSIDEYLPPTVFRYYSILFFSKHS